MEVQILELLKKENKAYSVQEIYDYLHLSTVDDFKELVKVLNKMEE